MRSHSPSFRLQPESMLADSITGSPSRHSGSSRNPGRAVTFTVIPAPPTVIPGSPNRHSGASRNLSLPTPLPTPPAVIPAPSTVIPAQAGIYPCQLHYRLPQPSFRLPQPSFRRKPESMLADSITGSPNRHSASPQPSFRRKPESMLADSIPAPPTVIPAPPTVIPAQAGIQRCRGIAMMKTYAGLW